jgi:hypothetical protein
MTSRRLFSLLFHSKQLRRLGLIESEDFLRFSLGAVVSFSGDHNANFTGKLSHIFTSISRKSRHRERQTTGQEFNADHTKRNVNSADQLFAQFSRSSFTLIGRSSASNFPTIFGIKSSESKNFFFFSPLQRLAVLLE